MSSIKRPNPNENWCHEKPDVEVVKHYLKKWKALRGGIDNDIMLALQKLFTKYPKNNDLNEVRDKVSVLDELYRTRISNAQKCRIVECIVNLKIDKQLKTADATLVNAIAKKRTETEKNVFSFASKYCSFHKPDRYPIFDSFVRKFLCHCKKTWKFPLETGVFSGDTLKDYPAFKEVIDCFRTHFGFKYFSYRKIDHYLWLAGKELEAEKEEKKKKKENMVNKPNK
jgi:hypothetical protein